MSEQESNNILSLGDLKEKIENNNFSSEDFKSYHEKLQKNKKEFISLLEMACKKNRKDKDLYYLFRKYTIESISDLMENLKKLGYGIQKELGESFEKTGYRLLEQVRAGKRSDVMYGITRIFISNQKNIPDILHEAFKPHYDIEIFKCLMYAFLGSAIKPKERYKEEE